MRKHSETVQRRKVARAKAHAAGHTQRPAGLRGGDTHRANKIWDAACEKRHKESCLLGKTRDFDYIKVFELKDRCVTGDDAACTELAQRAWLRDPTDAELALLLQLNTDIEATGVAEPAKVWMQAACFAAFSSAESVFY